MAPFRFVNTSIDEYKPIKVVVVGAGFSGILAGIRQRVGNLDLTIYEKNAGIGGTWYSNKYPGAACDVPSHCYQYSFTQKSDWSAVYSSSAEIRSYLEDVVEKWKLMPSIKLQHELIHAKYEESRGRWNLRFRRLSANSRVDDPQFEEFNDTADVLLTCIGPLSRWSWPTIDGLTDFKGRLVHSAQWDVNEGPWQEGVKDWGDKKVGVIGVGSSAIQIVPALQSYVGKLYNYVRGRTWICPPFFVSDTLFKMLNRDLSAEKFIFTDDDKKLFADPINFNNLRHEMETKMNSAHASTLKGSDAQMAARAIFKEDMIRQLQKKPWIADHLIPDFSVSCRRLTPGPDYLAALCEDNVDFIPTPIKRVTPTGIELVDGQHHDLDVLICATGYDTSFKIPFSVVGRNGMTISEKWSPHPKTYLSVCVDGFPNWFFCMGPNSIIGAGSLLVILEHQVDYVVAATMKLQRERLKSIEVKQEAVADFDEYLENYFPNSVFVEKCRSWYKAGTAEGPVVGLWPGSSLHAVRTLQNPRWEDYNYEYPDGVLNCMHWLGDGQTLSEKTENGDNAWYLNDDEVDVPPVPSA